MDRETQVEVVNICIVNALRIDEDHRMMIIEKLTQNMTDENRSKLLRLLGVVERSEQFYCVSSDALVYGNQCEKWCGDENCKALCKQ